MKPKEEEEIIEQIKDDATVTSFSERTEHATFA